MIERLTRLEGAVAKLEGAVAKLEAAVEGLRSAVEGLRHSQNLIVGVVSLGAAIIIAVLGYVVTRIDSLPGEFQRMNTTLSSAITAARAPPQIVVVPAPASRASNTK